MDEKITRLIKSVSQVFIEEGPVCGNCILALISGLHVLIEDFPGVGKTTLARAIAEASGLDFGRIQFTPDILPGDVLGMSMWISGKNDFVFREGQLHHQIIIADELNRASPRTQSAFLEAMQEERITVDGVTHLLPYPFFVIATQNPENFSGTFPLPEAQLDRFGISLSINYPNIENEVRILNTFCESNLIK
ncbi:MAG: AAA family ATPase, partial [Spirochaetes bacterium]|nr:AAA family ATPase [Spirochaetota bacterium]